MHKNHEKRDGADQLRPPPVTRTFHRTWRYNNLPSPPVIAKKFLTGPQLTFCEFLLDRNCGQYLTSLFGKNLTAGAIMVRDLKFARRGLYFGHRRSKPGGPIPKNPGVLNETNSASKAALKEFVRRAYRGDPERRGQVFRKRMAGLLWDIYHGLMAQRALSAKIERQEIARISKLGEQRRKGAARVQRHRAKIKAERVKQAKKASSASFNQNAAVLNFSQQQSEDTR